MLIIIGVISFAITCIELPREIYRVVRKHNYYHDLDNRDYWPVHDYYGNNVNIFEFEDFLKDNGAKDIIKGYYYKDSGDTAICYDFKADGIRFVLDNEIQECPGSYYSLNIRSRLSIYDGDIIYRTDYLSGTDYVMDYRSPMWVDRRVFNLLHSIMDDIEKGEYRHSDCSFANSDIAHYEENEDGHEKWHDDVYGN